MCATIPNPASQTWRLRIAELSNLEELNVGDSGLTDAAVEPLSGFTKLKKLVVKNTKVTAAGVAKLQQALPKCKIVWDDPAKAAPPQPADAGSK